MPSVVAGAVFTVVGVAVTDGALGLGDLRELVSTMVELVVVLLPSAGFFVSGVLVLGPDSVGVVGAVGVGATSMVLGSAFNQPRSSSS